MVKVHQDFVCCVANLYQTFSLSFLITLGSFLSAIGLFAQLEQVRNQGIGDYSESKLISSEGYQTGTT